MEEDALQIRAVITSTLIVLSVTIVGLRAAESETITGTAARSGTHKRPLLDVDGKRYELTPSDKADVSLAKLLNQFSEGDTGRYAITGTPSTVNGIDGIIVDSIVPIETPVPGSEGAAPAAHASKPHLV